MPVPNHPGVHLEVSRVLPLNSSLKIRRQFPVCPTGTGCEGVDDGEFCVGVDVIVAVRVGVDVASLVLVGVGGSGVGDFVVVGSGGEVLVAVAVGVGVLLRYHPLPYNGSA